MSWWMHTVLFVGLYQPVWAGWTLVMSQQGRFWNGWWRRKSCPLDTLCEQDVSLQTCVTTQQLDQHASVWAAQAWAGDADSSTRLQQQLLVSQPSFRELLSLLFECFFTVVASRLSSPCLTLQLVTNCTLDSSGHQCLLLRFFLFVVFVPYLFCNLISPSVMLLFTSAELLIFSLNMSVRDEV